MALLCAQHYLECDSCEKNPAKFLCNTCPCHLCKNCKSMHNLNRSTKNHDILSLTANKEDVLHCTEHTNKKLECYCNTCEKPVCTECIVWYHGQHSFQNLTTAFHNIIAETQLHKKEVETILLPKYQNLLAIEDAKGVAITNRADAIVIEIDNHTKNIIQVVNSVREGFVQQIRNEEILGHQQIKNSKARIEREIRRLQKIDENLKKKLLSKPTVSSFKSNGWDALESFRKMPDLPDFRFSKYRPGNITQCITESFGALRNPLKTESANEPESYEKAQQKR